MSSKKCPICDVELPEIQFILHERFCSTNMRRCSICNEPIQKDEYEDHKKENHSKEKCNYCGKLIEKNKFEEHRGKCSKKLKECAYCGLFLASDELHSHEHFCGSKTEECEYCREMVPRKEKELHMQYTCKGIKRENDRNNSNHYKTPQTETGVECCLCFKTIEPKNYDHHIQFECKGVERINNGNNDKSVDDILKKIVYKNKGKRCKDKEVIVITDSEDEEKPKNKINEDKRIKIIDDTENDSDTEEIEEIINKSRKNFENNKKFRKFETKKKNYDSKKGRKKKK